MSTEIGKRLRSLRKAQGLSQEAVARQTRVGLKAYGDLERGRTVDPHYSTLEDAARALGVTVAELLSEGAEVSNTGKASAPPEPGPIHHVRGVHDQIAVSDDVKILLEERFNSLIHDLEAMRRSKEAAALARMRDEVLAAVP
jgi:transcriptional regulator with XRE-family HTH domain